MKSELEKTKQGIEILEIQLKTCKNALTESNAGSRKELRMEIKDLKNSNVEFKVKEIKLNKTKQDLEDQMKTLKEDLKVA